MLAHDWLNCFAGLIGVVKRNGADVVVKNVSLDDAVEKRPSNETKFAVDGCGSATDVVPALTRVVRKSWIGVLEVGNGD